MTKVLVLKTQELDEASIVSLLVGQTIDAVERDLIKATLQDCGGNKSRAAEILGISVRTLRNKMYKYGKERA